MYNEILASDGEVKAAGASTRKDEEGARTPALSPAAALVCEWTPRKVEAAGGSTTPSAQELPAIGGTGGTAPAAAPVCEWTFKENGLAVISCSKYPSGPYPSHGDFCTSCGKPISFKEGSE
jgi:hypothetical protein